MLFVTQIQHLDQMSHDLQENPAAHPAQAAKHNGSFMLGLSDTDVWGSLPWLAWQPAANLGCAGGPTVTPDFTF